MGYRLGRWRAMKRHYEPLTRGNMRLRMDGRLLPAAAEKFEQCVRVVESWEKTYGSTSSTRRPT
eukprot:5839367-Amphidinium_carterae.1